MIQAPAQDSKDTPSQQNVSNAAELGKEIRFFDDREETKSPMPPKAPQRTEKTPVPSQPATPWYEWNIE
jgi:hypothetical protein